MLKKLLPIYFSVVTFFWAGMTLAQESQVRPAFESTQHAQHGGTRLGPHSGTLKTVGGVQAETIVQSSGIQLFLYDFEGTHIAAAGGRGTAALSVQGNPKRYRYNLIPADDGSFKADVNLSRVAGQQVTVDFQIVGVSAPAKLLAFREVTMVPADQAQQDAVAIARQKVCPVSGKPLGSMGDPIAVEVGGNRIFVCCAGCTQAITKNPTQYVGSRPKVELVAATIADAALIAKQARCPVMDEPLGSMGHPIKLLVGGKPIFLCCKGCIKKVEAEPEKYLAMTYAKNGSGAVPAGTDAVRTGVFKVTDDDAPFIAAQKTCPVMDEPLDAMGGPFKVHAAGKAIYICCPGCAKKIAADPEKYLAMLSQHGVSAPRIE